MSSVLADLIKFIGHRGRENIKDKNQSYGHLWPVQSHIEQRKLTKTFSGPDVIRVFITGLYKCLLTLFLYSYEKQMWRQTIVWSISGIIDDSCFL